MVTKRINMINDDGKGSVLAKIFMVTKQKMVQLQCRLRSVLAKIFMVTKLSFQMHAW